MIKVESRFNHSVVSREWNNCCTLAYI
ncbi:hypothetical protein ACQ9ZF_12170 (plasmid) [Cetobacterium somerae]